MDAVTVLHQSSSRQLFASGALIVNFSNGGPLVPYVAVGGGLATTTGSWPSARLVGSYQYAFSPCTGLPIPLQLSETDVVTVHAVTRKRAAFVVGGGIKYAMGSRLGLRVDLRDHVFGDPQRTELDASPFSDPSSPAVTATGPPLLAFGNIPQGGRPTLSGPQLSRFETFRATGLVHAVNIAAGLYWRF